MDPPLPALGRHFVWMRLDTQLLLCLPGAHQPLWQNPDPLIVIFWLLMLLLEPLGPVALRDIVCDGVVLQTKASPPLP